MRAQSNISFIKHLYHSSNVLCYDLILAFQFKTCLEKSVETIPLLTAPQTVVEQEHCHVYNCKNTEQRLPEELHLFLCVSLLDEDVVLLLVVVQAKTVASAKSHQLPF